MQRLLKALLLSALIAVPLTGLATIERTTKTEARQTVVPLVRGVAIINDETLPMMYCGSVRIKEDWLLTAAHCTPKKGGVVQYYEAGVKSGVVIAHNVGIDLAIIKTAVSNGPVAPLGSLPTIDDVVFGLGYPLGAAIGFQVLTEGTWQGIRGHAGISTVHGIFGDSGGAVFNEKGELVGITTGGFGVGDKDSQFLTHVIVNTHIDAIKSFIRSLV